MTLMPQLEHDLIAAAERRSRVAAAPTPRTRRMRPRRALAVALALVLVTGAGAAAGGRIFKEGPSVPAADPRDRPPTQRVIPVTAEIEPVTAPDPADGPPWGVRVAKNKQGEPCFVVGRVLNGKFGTFDGNEFHAVPTGGGETCAPAPDPLRYEVTNGTGRGAEGGITTVAGLVSSDVKSVEVNGPGGPRRLTISPHGVFITVYDGAMTPRDVPVKIVLQDGSTQDYRAPGVPG